MNLHERIDTSDFLGKIRPTNDGLFKWEDGVVVRAMKAGKLLLLDEISLAQDSVLERLNPLLETDRKLLLTDSGASTELIIAKSGFQFVATMNPGGDHGKKEVIIVTNSSLTFYFSCRKRCEIDLLRFGVTLNLTRTMFWLLFSAEWSFHQATNLTKPRLCLWRSFLRSFLAILIGSMLRFSSKYSF